MSGTGELAPAASPTARRAAVVALVALVVVVAILAARKPAVARIVSAAKARWREMHTPGGGRDRIVAPEVRAFVDVMRGAGISHYRFTPKLGDDIQRAPFILEHSWPIEVRSEDENVAGFASELAERKDCAVIGVAGKYALARCHL
jgi:hypothetical protein